MCGASVFASGRDSPIFEARRGDVDPDAKDLSAQVGLLRDAEAFPA